jgi:hypothetical protein
MKSLIPWKKQKREMANLRKGLDDWMDRFFTEPVFSFPEPFSEKSWYPSPIRGLDFNEVPAF